MKILVLASFFLMIFGKNLIAAEAGMPQLDPEYWASQAFWLILIFTLLYLSISKLFVPKIRNSIDVRNSKIKDDLDEESRWQELLESRRQKNKVRREYYLKRINGELEPGIFRSIGSSIVRLIDAMIKRLKDPKIIKQKVPPVKKYIPYDYSTGKPVDDDTKDD